jgi:hypothetical protein
LRHAGNDTLIGGAGAAVQFADAGTGLALTNSDFVVV